ncbi:glycosyltransferase [Cryptosporangium arvum]|uniref:glycosyltransferase n=1 Tax=Cryptosporangium arvum TaxID=80871 RepID=UPI0004B78C91|nr:glycosyltransferase [Cryptosporangium arvum]
MDTVFVVTAVAHLCAVVLLSVELVRGRRLPAAVVPVVCAAAGAGGALLTGRPAASAVGVLVLGAVAVRCAPGLRPSGAVAWATLLVSTAAGTVVGLLHLAGLTVHPVGLVLIWVVALVGVVRTPSSLLQLYENWEIGLRRHWRRSLAPLVDREPGGDAPLVTVQVPIHAEPPSVVIATLDALARLDYPHFEVLVIDNNTGDEELWRPVEQHCAELGDRFRFRHVEGITGAKAGALNWSRPHLDPRTALVALVDADYQVDPLWLRHTVGFFDDPEIGFVQCPHAYRAYEHSAYGRWANTGYEWAQVTEMRSRNEHGAGITVGTMSLIRLETLDAAGGWAEWCQTEDSEFAIRAHAAGYSSVLVDRAYGWGLIPETVAELKKQRFRWTYGPGQEFKAHARLYLPRPLGVPSRLTRAQRIRHGHYGLVVLVTGLGVLSLPVSLVLVGMMFARHDIPDVPAVLLLPLAAGLVARRIMRWTLFRTAVGAGFGAFLGACVALLAVKPTMSGAAFGVLIGRPARWQRTNKFRVLPRRFRFVRDAWSEIVLGAGCLALAIALPLVAPMSVATVVFALGFGWQALVYACAPLLAVLAERALRPGRAVTDHRDAGTGGDPGPHRRVATGGADARDDVGAGPAQPEEKRHPRAASAGAP